MWYIEYTQNLRKTNNQSSDITMEGVVWKPDLEVSVWRSNSLAPKIIVGGQLLCQSWVLHNPLDVPLDDVVRQDRHLLSQPRLPETDMILLTSHFLTPNIKMGDSARIIRIQPKENIYERDTVPHKARPSPDKYKKALTLANRTVNMSTKTQRKMTKSPPKKYSTSQKERWTWAQEHTEKKWQRKNKLHKTRPNGLDRSASWLVILIQRY